MKAMRWAMILLQIAGILLILIKAFPLLFHPTLMIDEAYYVGAAVQVLRGDWALTQYGFDKPFLLALWPLAGLLAFGVTPFGARIVGLICYLASFCFFQRALNRVSPKPVQNLVLVLAVYLLPLMIQHGATAMSEPYLLLMISLFLDRLLRSGDAGQDQKVMQVFWIGFFTKFTMVFWLPSLVFSRWPIRSWWTRGLRALGAAKWWWLAFFLLSLFNSTKFASLTWFANIGDVSIAPEVSSGTVSSWVRLLWVSLGGSWSSTLILLPVLAYGIYQFYFTYKKRSFESQAMMFWWPLLIHFLIIVLIGARSYDRYFITLIPGLMFCFVLFFERLNLKIKSLGPSQLTQSALYAIPLLLIAMVTKNFQTEAQPLHADAKLGRQLMLIAKEYDRPGVLLHTDFVWQSRPFVGRAIMNGCTKDDCISAHQVGFTDSNRAQTDQFVHRIQKEDPGFQFYRASNLTSPNLGQIKTRLEVVEVKQAQIQQSLLTSLRLKKSVQVTEFKVEPDQTFVLFGLLRGRPITIRGKLFLNEWARFPDETNRKQMTLVAEIQSFQISETEQLDWLMQIFYQSYAMHLMPIDVKFAQVPAQVDFRVIE